MPRLTHEVRYEIVKRLACYEKPADIVRWLKAELGLEVDYQRVIYHDPTRINGAGLAEKWRVIFEGARKSFLKDVENVPIANQGYRLAMLNKMLGEAIEAKNRGQALQIMEQAAKEIGGVYSNVRTLNTPDMAGAERLPTEERRDRLAALMDSALGRDLKNVTPRTEKLQ